MSLFTCVLVSPEFETVFLNAVVEVIAALVVVAVVLGVVRFVMYCLSIAVSFAQGYVCLLGKVDAVRGVSANPAPGVDKYIELSPSFIRDCTAL